MFAVACRTRIRASRKDVQTASRLLEIGFDGHIEMVDQRRLATPLGWAEYNGQSETTPSAQQSIFVDDAHRLYNCKVLADRQLEGLYSCKVLSPTAILAALTRCGC